ncbi:MAG TPA: molybdopterin-guanine dinucleotide biosynthesis protein B [Gammaproteobacteria bacterium]|nr:molybdopterin-guanine dinucleotide biosynthesis protein B [Gammaproteobacteria bacterium]
METLFATPPVLGFAAASGTGKTTLLCKLLPLLAAGGLRVGVIKHSHHDFDIDRPGKDSYRLRQAGARQMLIASPWRTAWIEEQEQRREPQLDELLQRLQRERLDLILVEGFRHVAFPKIELHRRALERPLLYPQDASIIAIASDEEVDAPLPRLDLNRPEEVAHFILDLVATMPNSQPQRSPE